LIYEPDRQKLDIEIVDIDMTSPPDPLAQRMKIPIKDFLGVGRDTNLNTHASSRHMMIPLHVIWANKAKEGGIHETTVKKQAQKCEEEGHHDQATFFEKMKSFASHAYASAKAEVAVLTEKFEKATGADKSDWSKLHSKVEIFATWRPIARYMPYRHPTLQERKLDPVTSVLFVGVLGAHQLPSEPNTSITYKAKVKVTHALDFTIKTKPGAPPKLTAKDDTKEDAKGEDATSTDKKKDETSKDESSKDGKDGSSGDSKKKDKDSKDSKDESSGDSKAAKAEQEKDEAGVNTFETEPVTKSQLHLSLSDPTWTQSDNAAAFKFEEIKRKSKILQQKGMNSEEIAELLDVPVSFIASEGADVLDYEMAAVWEAGYHVLLNQPASAQVTVEVFKVEAGEGGMLGGSKTKEESLGSFTYDVEELLRSKDMMAKKFRHGLMGANGAKVSCLFQLLNYYAEPDDAPQPILSTERVKGKGKGKEAEQVIAKAAGAKPHHAPHLKAPDPAPEPPPPLPEASASDSNSQAKNEPHDESLVDKAKHAVGGVLASVEGFFGHHPAAATSNEKQDQPGTSAGEKKAALQAKLDAAGLSDFKATFEEHGIDDEETATQISDAELSQMGLKMGHIKKFNAIFQKGHEYAIVNPSGLALSGIGIPYRADKSETADVVTYAPFGTTVRGIDQGDGWVKVGARFLPRLIDGLAVLELKGGAKVPESSQMPEDEKLQSLPREAPKELPREAPKELPREAPKEEPREEQKEEDRTSSFWNVFHGVAEMMHFDRPQAAKSPPPNAKVSAPISSKTSSKATSVKASSKAAAKATSPAPSEANTGSLRPTSPAPSERSY